MIASLSTVFARWRRAIYAARQARRRWQAGVAPSDAIKVFYGQDRLPGRTEVAQGGIVKCQDLAVRFPNEPQGANIVYLVSSALPPAAAPVVDAARRAGARFVLNQNGVAYPAWHGPGWERTNAPLRRMLQSADYVIYQSAFCKLSADRYLGPCPGPATILHNPVDTAVFVPGAPLPAGDGPVLLASGSHVQFYRVEAAIRALALVAARHPSARLILAGHLGWTADEAQGAREVRQLCGALGVAERVEISGRYTQAQARAILQRAQILVHTKYNDPCPRMVVEGMACGLPVVYSDSGGTPELVGREAGVGVPVPQGWDVLHAPAPEALAAAIEAVLERYVEFRDAARARAVQRFDVQPWLDRHALIFREVLNAPGAVGAGGAAA